MPLLVLLYCLFVKLERRAKRHIDALCLFQVRLCLLGVTVRRTLALRDVCTSLLFGGVALAFKCAQGVLFHLLVQLQFQFLIEAEVAHRTHRHVVYLVQSVRHELLFVVISSLERVIIGGAVLDEAAGENTRDESHKEEKEQGQELLG